ncbi:MAG: hypothetical protein RIR97_150 [Pseudomonadota bacterium]|jgi:diguanylate cyclase
MTAPSARDTSFALRIAQLMHKAGIASFPRNYELLYEAYSGHNPELFKDLIALGLNKSQAALDELGRKYVPHHHEQAILIRSNKQLQDQMEGFLSLLEQEKSSLSEYGQVIGAASETLATFGGEEISELNQSIQKLSAATAEKATKTELITGLVEQQAVLAKANTETIHDFERMKFIDPLTSVGNRRAFNKALARVYQNDGSPMPCSLGFLEVDRFSNHVKLLGHAAADTLLQNLANLIRSVMEADDFVARMDESRFVILAKTSDPAEAERYFDRLAKLAHAKLQISGFGNQSREGLTLSVGLSLAFDCDNAVTLTKFAETALATSMRKGGNVVTLFKPQASQFGDGVDRMLYR